MSVLKLEPKEGEVIVKGKKVKDPKKQHLKEGKEYIVTEETAKLLFKNGQAEKA